MSGERVRLTPGRLVGGVLLMALITGLLGCSGGPDPQSSAADPDAWVLEWNDEFDYRGAPDSEVWNVERHGPGAYNQELQAYTDRPENVRVEDGHLVIEAHPIPNTRLGYTSARINTRNRRNIFERRIEVRAMLPEGRGTWPAIWFLPVETTDRVGWPHSGEIDLMEHVGFDPGIVHGSVHTSLYNWPNGNHHTATVRVPTASSEFHVYALEWTTERLDFFVDEVLFTTFHNEGIGWEAWPFDVPFYLILNLAVGGEWGGAQGVDRAAYPTQFLVDWVRVFRHRDAESQ